MSNLAHAVAHINNQEVRIIDYQNLPVVTTALLADFYGTQAKNLQDNFLNNSDRFIEGKHFYKLQGAELKVFKNRPEIIGSVGKNAREVTLWTERGAARHAKMLNTDQAWEVFEKLEDSYFKQQEIKPISLAQLPNIPKNPHLAVKNEVLRLAGTRDVTYGKVYKRLYDRFQVRGYELIPVEYCHAAVEFIRSLEGEYLPRLEKAKPKSIELTPELNKMLYEVCCTALTTTSDYADLLDMLSNFSKDRADQELRSAKSIISQIQTLLNHVQISNCAGNPLVSNGCVNFYNNGAMRLSKSIFG